MNDKVNNCFTALMAEADVYLAFFKERERLEMRYAEDLLRLTQKGDDFEKEYHRGLAQSTLHACWIGMRQDSLRLADLHRKTALEIRAQVVDVATSLRDGKQRVRKRVKDELKAVTQEYTEYKATVGRYQKIYERACDQVKSIQQQNAAQDSLAAGDPVASPTKPALDIVSGVTTSHLRDNAPPPIHTAAVRVNDALKQSGQQISTFINRLGGSQTPTSKSPTEGSAAPHPNAASNVAKLVKAKKEAEVSDSDYRKGVYHLETLRLQKERVYRSAAQSVLEFVGELAEGIAAVCQNYCNILKWSALSSVAFVDHSLARTSTVIPDQDVAEYSAKLPVDTAIDPVTYYENAYIGRCKTLLFGVPLATQGSSADVAHLVPRFITLCIDGIESRLAASPHIEGVYRVSAVHRNIQRLVLECEKDANSFQFDAETDIHSITGLLKLFLRQLPHPLCSITMQERVALTKALQQGGAGAETELKTNLIKRFRRLSPVHQATLKAMVQHIKNVAAYEATTKMSMSNLSLMLTPVLFDGEQDAPLDLHGEKDILLEFIAQHFEELFEGLPVRETRPRSSSIPTTPLTAYPTQFDTEEEFPLREASLKAAPLESAQLKKVFSIKRRLSAANPVVSPAEDGSIGSRTHSLAASPARTPPPRSSLQAQDDVDPLAIYEAFATQAAGTPLIEPHLSPHRPNNALPPGAKPV